MAKRIPIDEQLRRAIAQAEKAGMTRWQMARAMDVADSQLQRIGNGTTVPKLTTAEQLADVLGFTIELIPRKGK